MSTTTKRPVRSGSVVLFCATAWGLLALTGCGAQSHDHTHDHHAGPETFAEAVADLQKVRDLTRDAFAAGDPERCHHALHEVGELLEAIPQLAAESELAETSWNEVKLASDNLFTSFGMVDQTLHSGKPDTTVYSKVAADIDSAIESLLAKTKEAEAAAGPEPAASSP